MGQLDGGGGREGGVRCEAALGGGGSSRQGERLLRHVVATAHVDHVEERAAPLHVAEEGDAEPAVPMRALDEAGQVGHCTRNYHLALRLILILIFVCIVKFTCSTRRL